MKSGSSVGISKCAHSILNVWRPKSLHKILFIKQLGYCPFLILGINVFFLHESHHKTERYLIFVMYEKLQKLRLKLFFSQ